MRRVLLRSALFLLGLAGLIEGCGEIKVPTPERGRVGTFFFFWHDCQPNPGYPKDRNYPYRFGPGNHCEQQQLSFHPLPMSGAPFRYSNTDPGWFAYELQQMKQAGIEYVFPVYWGDHPTLTTFSTNAISLMVQAMDRIGSDLKIGLFDDTTSQVCQWNLDSGRDYSAHPAMNLAEPHLWTYFYEKKIRVFFQTVPKRHWATHDGRSLEEGGRPIIITWIGQGTDPLGPSFYADHGASAALWLGVKQRFKNDFGVEPFLIFETNWYQLGADLSGVGDAEYSWGTAAFHSRWHERNGYIVSSVGPGYDDHLLRKNNPLVRPRNITHDTSGTETRADSVAFFRNEYLMDETVQGWPQHGVHKHSNLVLIETWNELYEGTGIEPMSDWPDLQNPGQRLASDTYTRALRELKFERPGYPKHDHTLVSTKRNTNGTWTFEIRNDGSTWWKADQTALGYRIEGPDGQVLLEATLVGVPVEVPFGGTVQVTFPQPGEWTDLGRFGNATLVLDMQFDGEWFTELGDGVLRRPIAPTGPTFF